MAKKKNKTNFIIPIVIIVAVIVFIYMIVVIMTMNSDEEVEQEITNEISVVVENQNIIDAKEDSELETLQSMTERNRIEYYVSKFIKYSEEGNYKEAYSLLNSEYKENYFPTQNDFQEYIENTFTKMMDVEYTNIERNGDIYVIWLTLTDAINGGPDSGTEMTFVVKESDFNDFELSFSVI